MQMTPSRKNKFYPPDSGAGMGVVISNSSSMGFNNSTRRSISHQNVHQQKSDQSRRNIVGNTTATTTKEGKYQHPWNNNHSQTPSQTASRKTPQKINKNEIEFIPLFALADACRENSERKAREICLKLMMLEAEEAETVVNFQDQTGRTALSYACGCGTINIIEEVSKFKFVNPNLADNDGNAPLHYSAVCGHYEGVDFLLRRFNGLIDLNARNTSGLTPLMKAALQGRKRCAKRLLGAGASPHLKDHIRGLTAAEWARLCGRHMCEEIINRSVSDYQGNHTNVKSSNVVYSTTYPNLREESYRTRMSADESPYYARSTVNGAKWLKNKIKKVLGASVRSGEDKSYVCDNPIVKSLEDRRPHERNCSALTSLGLDRATICASSLLLPDIQPIVQHQKQRSRIIKKMSIPSVQVTPVRRMFPLNGAK